MQKNKRGISGIIVALIMILLALVATGVIWVVIRNVTETSTGNIDLGEKCLAAEVSATKVVNSSLTDYTVTLKRAAGGEAIGGVKITLTNATGTTSYVYTSAGNIAELATKTTGTIDTTDGATTAGLINANKAEVTVYFVDDSGVEQICSQGRDYEFSL